MRRAILVAALAAAAGVPPAAARQPVSLDLVRTVRITYVAHDGLPRRAYVVFPRALRGPVPLVISPHGRGVSARDNINYWGNLPALGRFAVVNPEGQGRVLTLYSWGDPGEIDDLARMPEIVAGALPRLPIDRSRVYAFGGSMGGQETLLLVARHPQVLAGAASFDAPTNLAVRYALFPLLRFGVHLQNLMRLEIGGTPQLDPRAYALRSPIDYAAQIAFSGVPLQIWWSTRDRIVRDQARQSGLLYRRIEALNPHAPVVQFVGAWAHTAEMRPWGKLPYALSLFGLMPPFTTHAAGLVGAASPTAVLLP